MRPATLARLLEGDEGRRLRAAARAVDASRAAEVDRLRGLAARLGPEAARAALDLAEGERRMARKGFAGTFLADREGAEQATPADVAAIKAERVREAGVQKLLDLCCGVGGDTVALAQAAEVEAIDRSPARAWMAARNASVAAAAADVTSLPERALRARAVHVDPQRRGPRGRGRLGLATEPPLAWVAGLVEQAPAAMVKLAPATPLERLPYELRRTELWFVSRRRELSQVVLLAGGMARRPGLRAAIVLPGGERIEGKGGGAVPGRSGSNPRFVFEPDPALERSGLSGELAVREGLFGFPEGSGWLGGDRPVASPFLRPFELLAAVPLRESRLRSALRSFGAGPVDVKVRGGVADAAALGRKLRGRGDERLVVFAGRSGAKAVALIARRWEGGR